MQRKIIIALGFWFMIMTHGVRTVADDRLWIPIFLVRDLPFKSGAELVTLDFDGCLAIWEVCLIPTLASKASRRAKTSPRRSFKGSNPLNAAAAFDMVIQLIML